MKVAIIGTVPASRILAPYADTSWKIWGCSPGNQGHLPRVDAWFELHALVDMLGRENQHWCLPYFAWLKAQTFPVYMQEQNDSVPGALIFPRDAILQKFSSPTRRAWFFTSSVTWMMAHALMQGAKEIGLFGIDMAATEEHYSGQKAGCLHMIDVAEAMGCKVTVPFESCLAAPLPLYGYSEATNFGRKLNVRMNDIVNTRAQMVAQRDKLSLEIAYFDGALEDCKYVMRTFTDGADYDMPGVRVHEAAKTLEAGQKTIDDARSGFPDLARYNDHFQPSPAGNGLVIPSETAPVDALNQIAAKVDDPIADEPAPRARRRANGTAHVRD